MLLLEQVHQVRGRSHALEAPYRIEDDIKLALRHRGVQQDECEPLNLTH